MKLSTDVFANLINTMKCLEEIEDCKKTTTEKIFEAVEHINNLSDMYEKYEVLPIEERKLLRLLMKETGKIFLENSYKLFNILHRIEELKTRLNKFTNI